MGKKSRDKGYRAEREVVNLLKSRGYNASRVPLSGAVEGFTGDVLIVNPGMPVKKAEVKIRASGFGNLYSWLEDNNYLFIRRDNSRWLVVADIEEAFPNHTTSNSSYGIGPMEYIKCVSFGSKWRSEDDLWSNLIVGKDDEPKRSGSVRKGILKKGTGSSEQEEQ